MILTQRRKDAKKQSEKERLAEFVNKCSKTSRLCAFALKMLFRPIFDRFAEFVQMFVEKMSAVFK